MIGGEVDAAGPSAMAGDLAVDAWPALAIVVFIIHQVLLPNRAKRR